MDFIVVIPARFASTRLPGKPLADIGDKPMVVRVAERAKKSGASRVVIATDHPDVKAAAEPHGHFATPTIARTPPRRKEVPALQHQHIAYHLT